jgi:spermidine synthase
VDRLVCVALDPEETRLVSANLGPALNRDLDDPRLQLVHEDPRAYISAPGEQFDLIVVDVPDPDNARINRLYTREFFLEAQARLAPKGVLAASISGAENYWSAELRSYGRILFETIRSVFREVVITAGDRHYLIASDAPGVVSDDPLELALASKAAATGRTTFRPNPFASFFRPWAGTI